MDTTLIDAGIFDRTVRFRFIPFADGTDSADGTGGVHGACSCGDYDGLFL